MPVRIIFRGLVLFQVKEGAEGTVVAKLVGDKRTAPAVAGEVRPPTPTPHGGHGIASGTVTHEHLGPHDHEAELHAFSIERDVASDKEKDKVDFVGLGTRNIKITFDNGKAYPVSRAASYDAYCPKLSDIMGNLTGNSNDPPRHTNKAVMDSFVRNTVTVHGGTIRVREVVSWDGGAFPLPDERSAGVTVDTPAEVKFVGSTARDFMASECVIDVEEAESASIAGSGARRLRNPLRGSATHNSLRIPPKYIEILITNFPPQRANALPWSAHFRWLFEAAGYRPIRLRNEDFAPFEAFARDYDNGAVDDDMPLLKGQDGEFPIPWVNEVFALSPQKPSRASEIGQDDPWNRPLCPQGDE